MNAIYSKPIVFAIVAAVVILIGTIASTLAPMLFPSTQPAGHVGKAIYVRPYSPVELEGRDIYIREGCNNCHTQTVRPLRHEVILYDPIYKQYTDPRESAYDRPFLWGSKRTGPDLMSVGRRKPAAGWHYRHMDDPRSIDPKDVYKNSNMPAYGWLAGNELDISNTYAKISTLSYGCTDEQILANKACTKEEVQKKIADFTKEVTSDNYVAKKDRDKVTPEANRAKLTEMDAIVAYLLKLGRDMGEVYKKQQSK